MKSMTTMGLGLLVAGFLLGHLAEAAPSAPNKFSFSSVPAPELPAKAATIVKEANARDRDAVTIDVVRAAVRQNPAAAPAIVGAVARAVPSVAETAAAIAATEQPSQAAQITRAAVAAAPSRVGKIVTAVCRAVPNEYRTVAVAASQAAPNRRREILDSVGVALPQLKGSIQQSLVRQAGNAPSVEMVLDSAKPAPQDSTLASTATPPVRGPVIEPPYIPLTQPPVYNTTLTNTPPGGRDYTAP